MLAVNEASLACLLFKQINKERIDFFFLFYFFYFLNK